jgi:hypothetical protein
LVLTPVCKLEGIIFKDIGCFLLRDFSPFQSSAAGKNAFLVKELLRMLPYLTTWYCCPACLNQDCADHKDVSNYTGAQDMWLI